MNNKKALNHLSTMIADYKKFVIPSQEGESKKIMEYDLEVLEYVHKTLLEEN